MAQVLKGEQKKEFDDPRHKKEKIIFCAYRELKSADPPSIFSKEWAKINLTFTIVSSIFQNSDGKHLWFLPYLFNPYSPWLVTNTIEKQGPAKGTINWLLLAVCVVLLCLVVSCIGYAIYLTKKRKRSRPSGPGSDPGSPTSSMTRWPTSLTGWPSRVVAKTKNIRRAGGREEEEHARKSPERKSPGRKATKGKGSPRQRLMK